MREVTPAEARVVRALLDGSADRGDRHTLYAGLPRSTFVVARRRVYAEGWVMDRYVPNPSPVGLRWARIVLARPFADKVEALADRWRDAPGAVVVWRHPEVVLGIFLLPRAPAAGKKDPVGEVADLASRVHRVEGDPAAAVLPVYFDYAALWARLAHLDPPAHYPRGLGGPAPPTPEMRRWSAGASFPTHLQELLARTPPSPEEGTALHRLGPFGLPRSKLRLLSLGFVERRVFPNFARMPAILGYAVTRFFLLYGQLVPEHRASELFGELIGESRVHPFLFAADGKGVVVGALAGESAAEHRRGPTAGTPALTVLQRHLRGMETYWGELGQLETPVDHDYTELTLGRP